MTDTATAPAPVKTNDKAKWEVRLRGEKVITHPDDPDYGFYRIPRGDTFATVAYWYEKDGTLRCRIDGKDADERAALEWWTWACERPISYELFKQVGAGEPWPDLGVMLSNSKLAVGDNTLDGIRDAIENLKRDALRVVTEAEATVKAGAIPTADKADYAANLANALGALQKRADKARLDEKRPFLDDAAKVDVKWKPVLAAADIYTALKAKAVKPYLDEMQRRKDARVAAARAAAEAAMRTGSEQQQEAAREALVEAEAAPVTAGTVGRSVGLRGQKTAVIEDIAKVFEFFKDAPDVIEVLQKKANAAVRTGIVVPGTRVEGGKKAT